MYITNPITKRSIKIGGPTYNDLLRIGYKQEGDKMVKVESVPMSLAITDTRPVCVRIQYGEQQGLPIELVSKIASFSSLDTVMKMRGVCTYWYDRFTFDHGSYQPQLMSHIGSDTKKLLKYIYAFSEYADDYVIKMVTFGFVPERTYNPYWDILHVFRFITSPKRRELWEQALGFVLFKTMQKEEDLLTKYNMEDRHRDDGYNHSYMKIQTLRQYYGNTFEYIVPQQHQVAKPSMTIKQMKLYCKDQGIEITTNITRENKLAAAKQLQEMMG